MVRSVCSEINVGRIAEAIHFIALKMGVPIWWACLDSPTKPVHGLIRLGVNNPRLGKFVFKAACPL